MANESDVRQRVSKMLRGEGFFVQPIETGAIMEGVPDLWYSSAASGGLLLGQTGCSGWLELKKVRNVPARSTTSLFASANHPLSVEQTNWITRCIESGSQANILVAWERKYFFVPGRFADEFNTYTMKKLELYEIKKEEIPYVLRRLR